MTDYKNIHGKRVKFFTSDLDNAQAEGQIFYSSTDATTSAVGAFNFKTAVSSAAWSSSSPMVNNRAYHASAGTLDAALAIAGSGPPYPSAINLNEEYNGTGFSTGGTLNTSLIGLNGSGTQTAALAFGGFKPPSNTTTDETEEYNGTAWTAGGDLGTARFFLASAKSATQTAGLAFGGSPGYTNATEEYNGSAWTAGGNMNQGRNQFDGAGTQTSGLAVGGQHHPPLRKLTDVEEYDGSSWTAATGIPAATEDNAASGLQTAGLTYGGTVGTAQVTTSLEYDGTNWTATPSMANARHNFGGTGTGASSALATGGGPPSDGRSITEEFNTTSMTITAGAWSSGGNLNTARRGGAGFGTQNAAVAASGNTSAPGYTGTGNSEEYNGSSWTEGENVNTSRAGIPAAGYGPQTAGNIVGGEPPTNGLNNYETYESKKGG